MKAKDSLTLATESDRSRRRSQSASDLGKSKIGVASGVRTVPFSSDSTYDCDAYDPMKTRLSES